MKEMFPMKTYFCLLSFCYIFLIKNFLFGQEVEGELINANITSIFQSSFTQIGAQAWGAGGAYVARKGLPTAAFLNPAGLEANDFLVYVESGKRLKSDYIFGLDSDNQYILPSIAGISFPVSQLVLSLGYASSYNSKLVNNFLVRTVAAPDGTGESIEFESNLKIQSFFSALKYQINNNFSFGFTAMINYLKDEVKLSGELSSKGIGYDFGVIAGGLVTISKALSFGLGFKYNHEIEYDLESYNVPLLNAEDPGNPIILDVISTTVLAKIPWSAQVGVTLRPAQSLTLSAMVDYQNWSRPLSNFENQLQRHFGVMYQFSNAFRLSFGAFTMSNPAEVFFNGVIDQNFLTASFFKKLSKQVEVSLTVVDAHLLTDNDFQQTYIMAGVQYGIE